MSSGEASHVIAPAVFGLFDWTNFVASLVGIMLALFAIWLSREYRQETDALNVRINTSRRFAPRRRL